MNPAPCTRCLSPVEPVKQPSRCLRPDLCRSCRKLAAATRYRQSENGRATRARCQARYVQSDKGRAVQARFFQSEKGRAALARYRESDKCRATKARCWARRRQLGEYRLYQAQYQARYRKTDKGRAQMARCWALRRGREANAIVLEYVDRETIFVLDGGLCHLCDVPVEAGAFEVDHVIPIAVEPIEAQFNCAVAHKSCNRRKGARTVGLSPSARARWQERRPEHLAALDQHLARHAA